MHSFVDFPPQKYTHKIYIHSIGILITTCIITQIIHQYHIMEVCNCSKEIIIKVVIYFYDLSSQVPEK